MQPFDIQVKQDNLSVEACIRFVQEDSCGGLALFIGTVRNKTQDKKVVQLEFEAYEPMAISEIKKICHTIKKKWEVVKVSVHHRLGRLSIGEKAVVIAVSTPHRKEAFTACQYVIDNLKKTVPIWKKEVFEDGEIWVAAHP